MRQGTSGVRLLVAALVAGAAAAVVAGGGVEPFAFLTSDIRLDFDDRDRLDAGKAVVKVLPGAGLDLAVVAAARTDAPPDRLIAWTSDIAALQQGRYVSVIARFSDPPRIDDLDALALDESDLSDLRSCRPGDCGIKLSAGEIARLQQHIGVHADWKGEVQLEFRRVVLDRVVAYLADGDFGLPPYNDDPMPVVADVEVAALIDRLGLITPRLPGLAAYLQLFPRVDHPNVVESFLYWSRETLGVKPITSVTHVTLLRSEAAGWPSALVISKQVLATHYRNGAVSVTAIAGSGAQQYLVYLHRSHVDMLQGLFGGLVRRVIERRVRDEAPALLNRVRGRLEGGEPP